MPSLSCGLTNISEIMICCIKIRSMLWWRYIIHKAEIALKLLFNDHRQGRVQPLITVSAVVGALWVKLEPFCGWRCHIIPVVTPLLYPARTLLSPHLLFLLSAVLPPAAVFVTRPFPTHLPFFPPFLFVALCLKPTHLSQCPKRYPSISPLVLFYVLSLHPSIYPSPPPPLSSSFSFPLISLPMLWFVSPISVRTVITAVSSLGENKVVLCSRHHKRWEK